MILDDINEQLESLYCTDDLSDGCWIGVGIPLDGDRCNFRFLQEDDKYSRIETNRNFSEWIAWVTGSWRAAAPVIEQLAKPYGVQWDNEDGVLFIRFRRNELTAAQAVVRLHQAVMVIAFLKDYT